MKTSWPFRDIKPEDITRFAEEGRWDLVERATRLASIGTGDPIRKELYKFLSQFLLSAKNPQVQRLLDKDRELGREMTSLYSQAVAVLHTLETSGS